MGAAFRFICQHHIWQGRSDCVYWVIFDCDVLMDICDILKRVWDNAKVFPSRRAACLSQLSPVETQRFLSLRSITIATWWPMGVLFFIAWPIGSILSHVGSTDPKRQGDLYEKNSGIKKIPSCLLKKIFLCANSVLHPDQWLHVCAVTRLRTTLLISRNDHFIEIMMFPFLKTNKVSTKKLYELTELASEVWFCHEGMETSSKQLVVSSFNGADSTDNKCKFKTELFL